MIPLNLKGDTSLSFQGKHIIRVCAKKLKAAHPVNYFPGFLGNNVKNCPPIKLFLFTSLVPCGARGPGRVQNRISEKKVNRYGLQETYNSFGVRSQNEAHLVWHA